MYPVSMVPGANIAAMIVVLGFCVLFPIALCVFWKLRAKANLSAFFIGCGTFILFALILEQILHGVVLAVSGTFITENIWLYALYGGLAAGMFEETGRYLAMRFVMRKNLNRQNAIMYGIGHGGVEAMLITGMVYVSNLIMTLTINSGGLEAVLGSVDADAADALYAQVSQLWLLSPSDFLLAAVERFSAILLHIMLSYLVYRAVKDRKTALFILAVGIHFAVDAGTILLISVLPISLYTMEGLLLSVMAVFVGCMIRAYAKEGEVS